MNFEKYSKHYIHYFSDCISPTLERELQKYFGKSVCDLGCGDGACLFALKKKGFLNKFSQVYAVDLSLDRLSMVQSVDKQIKVVAADACNMLEIPDESVDFIISTQVIEHVRDEREMVKEMKRILKKRGKLYLSTVFKKWYGFYPYRNANGNFVLDPTHLREYTQDRQLLNKFGEDFELLMNDKKLFKFPLTDFILKRMNFDQRIYENNQMLRLIRKITVPIFGYFNWELLFQKK